MAVMNIFVVLAALAVPTCLAVPMDIPTSLFPSITLSSIPLPSKCNLPPTNSSSHKKNK